MYWDVYDIDLGFDTLTISANFADAACTICYECDGEWISTPYQVADARHIVAVAAELVIGEMGSDYYWDGESFETSEEALADVVDTMSIERRERED